MRKISAGRKLRASREQTRLQIPTGKNVVNRSAGKCSGSERQRKMHLERKRVRDRGRQCGAVCTRTPKTFKSSWKEKDNSQKCTSLHQACPHQPSTSKLLIVFKSREETGERAAGRRRIPNTPFWVNSFAVAENRSSGIECNRR